MPNNRVQLRNALLFARCPQPVDVCDEFGTTPLMIAATQGSLVAVQLFLRLGASITRPNSIGATALMMASACKEEGSEEVVLALLQAGADVNGRDNAGNGLCSYVNSVSKLRALQESGLDLDQILNTNTSCCSLLQELMSRLERQTTRTATILPMLQGLCLLLPTNALNRVDAAGSTVLDVAMSLNNSTSTPSLDVVIETLVCAGARQLRPTAQAWWGLSPANH